MGEPKTSFENILRGVMNDIGQQWQIAAYGRPVTGELVQSVNGYTPQAGEARQGSFAALAEMGDLYGDMPGHDGKVPAYHLTDERGLAEFQTVQASLEPGKQEPRFSDLYGPEHYAEVAGHIQPDLEAHQGWMSREQSPLMDEMRGNQIRVNVEAARLGVDTSAPNTQPHASHATTLSLGEHRAGELQQGQVQEQISAAALGIGGYPSRNEPYQPITASTNIATFAELAEQSPALPDHGLSQELGMER